MLDSLTGRNLVPSGLALSGSRWRGTPAVLVEWKDRRVISAGSKETRVRLASFSEVGERGECWAALIDLGGPTDPARVRADRPDQPTIKLPVNIARPFSILLLSSSFVHSIILTSSSIPLGRAHSTSRYPPSFSHPFQSLLVLALSHLHPESGILWIFMWFVI